MGGGEAAFIPADLSSRREVQKLAEEVGTRYPRLDVLINNAGVMFGQRQLSPDGNEMTFAITHLARFQLTNLLLPKLAESPSARIVNVSSDAHRGVALDFSDLQNTRNCDGWKAYCRSKLANIYFTYELASRLRGSKISVNALSPGFVATKIGIVNGYSSRDRWQQTTQVAISEEEGAQTSIFLATSPSVDGCSGMYFVKCQPARSSYVSYNRMAAAHLWERSAELVL